MVNLTLHTILPRRRKVSDMIRVVMTDNKPDQIYQSGTKFQINPSNGNLTVNNDSDTCIATRVHGHWASVSVDNTQNYVDKLTPEMVSGEWTDVVDQSQTYDTRGTSFIDGVTNFCVSTVTEALNCFKLSSRRENLTLLIDVSLYNRLEDSYEFIRKPDGVTWHRFNIEINPVDQDASSGFLNTLIRHTSGKTVKLITREY